MKIGNYPIGSRLAAAFAVLLLFMAIMLGVGWSRLQVVAQETEEMMEKPLTKERLVSDWFRTLSGSVQRYTLVARLADAEYASGFVKEGAQVSKILSQQQQAVSELISSDAERAALDKVIDLRKNYLAARDAIFSEKINNNHTEAQRILETEFTPASTNYLDALQSLMQLQREEINSKALDVQKQYRAGLIQLWVIGSLAILSAIFLAFIVTRSITKPLKFALETARAVADGDLRLRNTDERTDEIGLLLQALSQMVGRLREIVSDVRQGAENIHLASSEIARGNLDLSSRTEEQASALEQTAASMEEMTSTVSQNAENAQAANSLALAASSLALRGGEVASGVVITMGHIHDSSRKVEDIIGVIDSIAFQTNILALNAAVEAARAGEMGRGFAVVASEVRSLAGRSANAAKEIKTLISESVSLIDAGHKQVEEAGDVIKEVVVSVRRVTDIVGEISAASQEQSQGLEQVRDAISQLDSVTQQNAALVEEAAGATGAQEKQASDLLHAMKFFSLESQNKKSSIEYRILD